METSLDQRRNRMLTIGAVERETGLSKDVLRVWERRYQFPQPTRDAHGERTYPIIQVERLRAIRRLIDAGHRPGKLLAMSEEALGALEASRADASMAQEFSAAQRQILECINANDATGLRQGLSQILLKEGIQHFTMKTVARLNQLVSEGWMRGDLRVYQEHMYAEAMQAVLRTAIGAMPKSSSEPRTLITTLPGEQYGLGILMVEALLSTEGATTVTLGTQLPISETIAAANALKTQVVCLSFSASYPTKQAVVGLRALRNGLPADVAIWVGGELTRRIRRDVDGVVIVPNIDDVLVALRQWRAERFASAEAEAVAAALSAKL